MQWKDGVSTVVKVPLVTDSSSSLRNEWIQIANAPTALVPDETGCYCFDSQDERFVFVHAFFYATEQVRQSNTVLQELSIRPAAGIRLALNRNSEGQTTGGGTDFDGTKIDIGYAQPALDVSILAHEVGHAVHIQVLGFNLSTALNCPDDPMTAPLDQLRLCTFQLGIVEGAAQLAAVLFTGDSQVGRTDWLDAAMEMDRFVRFPDQVPTPVEHFTRWATAPLFSARYPRSAKLARDLLDNTFGFPHFEESKTWPFPYLASAAVTQPMIEVARRFGSQEGLRLHLRALSLLRQWRGYRDWATSLVNAADRDEVRAFLLSEFTQRGLFTDSANP